MLNEIYFRIRVYIRTTFHLPSGRFSSNIANSDLIVVELEITINSVPIAEASLHLNNHFKNSHTIWNGDMVNFISPLTFKHMTVVVAKVISW